MEKIIRFNKHFEDNYFYEDEKKREFYEELIKKLDNKLIVGLFGLRRVGKTTSMKYLINYLIKDKNVQREKILYFSFDDITYSIWNVIEKYEQYLGKKIDSSYYLFFDEIQKIPNYDTELKEVYDIIKPKIIISGSESTVIRKSTESLAGRIFEMQITPLSFKEYLIFKGLNHLIDKNMDYTVYFEEYLYKQFPEIVNFNLNDAKEYVDLIVKKIIYEDLTKIFSVKEPDLLFKLFKFVSYKPGIYVDYSQISAEFGVSRNTISIYFEYLEKSFLIKKIYNYSNNAITSEKKLKRYYTYPVLCYFCENLPEIIESYILMQNRFNFFHKDSRKNEIDFVSDKSKILGEVKYQNTIRKKDIKNLINFKEKFGFEKLILVKKYSSQIFIETSEIEYINAWEIEN